MTLGMFLRYVLEALKKPPGSKMSKFGSAALESFKQRLAADESVTVKLSATVIEPYSMLAGPELWLATTSLAVIVTLKASSDASALVSPNAKMKHGMSALSSGYVALAAAPLLILTVHVAAL